MLGHALGDVSGHRANDLAGGCLPQQVVEGAPEAVRREALVDARGRQGGLERLLERGVAHQAPDPRREHPAIREPRRLRFEQLPPMLAKHLGELGRQGHRARAIRLRGSDLTTPVRAPNRDGPALLVDVLPLQGRGFADAHPGLCQRSAQWIVAWGLPSDGVEQSRELLAGQTVGVLVPLGFRLCLHPRGRVAGEVQLLGCVAEHGLHHAQRSVDGCGRQPLGQAVPHRHDVAVVHGVHVHLADERERVQVQRRRIAASRRRLQCGQLGSEPRVRVVLHPQSRSAFQLPGFELRPKLLAPTVCLRGTGQPLERSIDFLCLAGLGVAPLQPNAVAPLSQRLNARIPSLLALASHL
ncbi:MAG: hypothetical protein OXT09_30885 [Myxococcales bacterium]|nr:hypothetical protein [Myxococcales bacterium]